MFEEKKESFLYSLTCYFEKEFQVKSLCMIFLVGLICNALAWIIALFAPRIAAEIVVFLGNVHERVFYYLLIFPFFFSFLMAFAVCKFVFRKHDRMLVADEEFMSRYASYSKGENLRRVFLISAMFGAINAILLVLGIIWFREK